MPDDTLVMEYTARYEWRVPVGSSVADAIQNAVNRALTGNIDPDSVRFRIERHSPERC